MANRAGGLSGIEFAPVTWPFFTFVSPMGCGLLGASESGNKRNPQNAGTEAYLNERQIFHSLCLLQFRCRGTKPDGGTLPGATSRRQKRGSCQVEKCCV